MKHIMLRIVLLLSDPSVTGNEQDGGFSTQTLLSFQWAVTFTSRLPCVTPAYHNPTSPPPPPRQDCIMARRGLQVNRRCPFSRNIYYSVLNTIFYPGCLGGDDYLHIKAKEMSSQSHNASVK